MMNLRNVKVLMFISRTSHEEVTTSFARKAALADNVMTSQICHSHGVVVVIVLCAFV